MEGDIVQKKEAVDPMPGRHSSFAADRGVDIEEVNELQSVESLAMSAGSTMSTEYGPSVSSPGRQKSVRFQYDDDVSTILKRAAEFGRFWQNDVFLEATLLTADELAELYLHGHESVKYSDLTVHHEAVDEFEIYMAHSKAMMDEIQGRSDEFQCGDPECGWDDEKGDAPLMPHQVVHAMIYHSDGMLSAMICTY